MNKVHISLITVLLTGLLVGSSFTYYFASAITSGGGIPTTVIEDGSLVQPASYTIFTDGTTVWARNGTTGAIDLTGTADYTINNAIANLTGAAAGSILIREGTYSIDNSIAHTFANNRGITISGVGWGTLLQPSAAMNVLEFDMGTSNYQGLIIEKLRFDLNDTNSTAIRVAGAGQHGGIHNVWITNVIDNGQAPGIIIDDNSHDFTVKDVRIRGQSTGDGITVAASNGVILTSIHISGAGAAVNNSFGNTLTGLTIQNSVFEDNVHALHIDGRAGSNFNFIGNWVSVGSGVGINATGFNSSTSRIFGFTIRDNYFTGMDLAAEDAIRLRRIDGVLIDGNLFRGTGSVAVSIVDGAVISNVTILHSTYDAVIEYNTNLCGSTASVASAGTISHGLSGSPDTITLVGSNSSNIIAITARSATTFTVTYSNYLGATPNPNVVMTIDWCAVYKP
jgi:hypothetical protein